MRLGGDILIDNLGFEFLILVERYVSKLFQGFRAMIECDNCPHSFLLEQYRYCSSSFGVRELDWERI
jgi:hypothetical protein